MTRDRSGNRISGSNRRTIPFSTAPVTALIERMHAIKTRFHVRYGEVAGGPVGSRREVFCGDQKL
jgi:hypothetical protein